MLPSRRTQVAAASAVYILLQRKRRPKRKHSIWVHKWLARREIHGAYHALQQELRLEDPIHLQNFLRMTAADFEELAILVGPIIHKQDTPMRQAIPVRERLSITLRFLATGDSYASLMYLFRVSETTISRIIPEVCRAIYQVLKDDYMKFPSDSDQWLNIASEFEDRWNFPRCIGAIDGKHITMKAPPSSGSYYFNYKGFHSIVLMAMVDAKYRVSFIDVGCNGRVADGGIFSRCSLALGLENKTLDLPPPKVLQGRKMKVPYVMVADDAFPLRDNIMKPYPLRDIPGAMRIFNYRLSRARRIVENAFGLLSSVFRVFRKPIPVGPEVTEAIVLASCVLHNFMLSKKLSQRRYAPCGTFDEDNGSTTTPGSWRKEGMPNNNLLPIEKLGGNHHALNPTAIRDEFRDYFLSPLGELPWQYAMI